MAEIERLSNNIERLNSKFEGIEKELRAIAELMIDNAVLQQKLIQVEQFVISSNQKHDEGRKVIHKRMDTFAKIGFYVGGSVFTAMGGVIWTLFNKVYGG